MYVDEGAALWKQGLNAAEAAGDMTKQVDELVDAGKAAAHLAESGAAAAEGSKLTDRIMEAGQRANKTLAATGNVGYSGEAITMWPTFSLISTQKLTLNRKHMSALVENIAENGILEPIKVVNVDNSFYVVDGHHRLRAAKLLKMDFVPVEEVFLPFNSSYRTVNDLQWKW